MAENSCYTYFRISGDFDPDIVTERLGLQPDRAWKIGDKRGDGTEHNFASWEIGRCEQYDVMTENQMHKTIDFLVGKVELLNELRKEFDVFFALEVVPTIYIGNTPPSLAPSLEVIDFCHATRTELDIDIYLMEQE